MRNLLDETMTAKGLTDELLAKGLGRCMETVRGARLGSRRPGPTVITELAQALELDADELGANVYRVCGQHKKDLARRAKARETKKREAAKLAAQPLLINLEQRRAAGPSHDAAAAVDLLDQLRALRDVVGSISRTLDEILGDILPAGSNGHGRPEITSEAEAAKQVLG